MEDAHLVDVFKISVLTGFLNLENKDNFIKNLNEIKKGEGRKISNLSGFQSYDLSHNDEVFFPFLKEIEFHTNKLAFQLGLQDTLKVSNFWLNVNKYKDSNSLHNHPGAVFSGVYYINVPKNSGAIVFRNPAIHFLEMYWPNKFVKDFNCSTSSLWKINPGNNQVVIFPAWLDHFVEPNMNEMEERISIAFNVERK